MVGACPIAQTVPTQCHRWQSDNDCHSVNPWLEFIAYSSGTPEGRGTMRQRANKYNAMKRNNRMLLNAPYRVRWTEDGLGRLTPDRKEKVCAFTRARQTHQSSVTARNLSDISQFVRHPPPKAAAANKAAGPSKAAAAAAAGPSNAAAAAAAAGPSNAAAAGPSNAARRLPVNSASPTSPVNAEGPYSPGQNKKNNALVAKVVRRVRRLVESGQGVKVPLGSRIGNADLAQRFNAFVRPAQQDSPPPPGAKAALRNQIREMVRHLIPPRMLHAASRNSSLQVDMGDAELHVVALDALVGGANGRRLDVVNDIGGALQVIHWHCGKMDLSLPGGYTGVTSEFVKTLFENEFNDDEKRKRVALALVLPTHLIINGIDVADYMPLGHMLVDVKPIDAWRAQHRFVFQDPRTKLPTVRDGGPLNRAPPKPYSAYMVKEFEPFGDDRRVVDVKLLCSGLGSYGSAMLEKLSAPISSNNRIVPWLKDNLGVSAEQRSQPIRAVVLHSVKNAYGFYTRMGFWRSVDGEFRFPIAKIARGALTGEVGSGTADVKNVQRSDNLLLYHLKDPRAFAQLLRRDAQQDPSGAATMTRVLVPMENSADLDYSMFKPL